MKIVGGSIEHTKQFLSHQVFPLKPLLSFSILGLLLTSVATKGILFCLGILVATIGDSSDSKFLSSIAAISDSSNSDFFLPLDQETCWFPLPPFLR